MTTPDMKFHISKQLKAGEIRQIVANVLDYPKMFAHLNSRPESDFDVFEMEVYDMSAPSFAQYLNRAVRYSEYNQFNSLVYTNPLRPHMVKTKDFIIRVASILDGPYPSTAIFDLPKTKMYSVVTIQWLTDPVYRNTDTWKYANGVYMGYSDPKSNTEGMRGVNVSRSQAKLCGMTPDLFYYLPVVSFDDDLNLNLKPKRHSATLSFQWQHDDHLVKLSTTSGVRVQMNLAQDHEYVVNGQDLEDMARNDGANGHFVYDPEKGFRLEFSELDQYLFNLTRPMKSRKKIVHFNKDKEKEFA